MHRGNERGRAHLVDEDPDDGEHGCGLRFVQGVLPASNGDDRLRNNEGDQAGDDQGAPPENINEEGPDEFEEEVCTR